VTIPDGELFADAGPSPWRIAGHDR
jgi:hypothetical protein